MRLRTDTLTPDLLAATATIARPAIQRRAQRVRDRSHAARNDGLPKLARRAAAVLAWLEIHGPATDRHVMHGLGFTDMNAVRPRISELIDAWLLVECGERRCLTTGQRVRMVRTA